VERVNVTNTVIVNRTYVTNVYDNRVTNVTYRNRAVPGAVTAVSRSTFTSAERIGEHRVRFDERQFERVGTTAMAPQIQPVHESRLGGPTRVNFRAPPQTIVNRQVIVKREPPPAAAPLTRNNGGHVDTPRIDRPIAPSERTPRTQDFGRGAQVNPNEPVVHLRPDRPARAERQTPETAPRTQPTVPDQHAYAEQPRNEQPRDDRPQRAQQDRDAQAHAQQQHEAEYRQRQQYEQQRESHDQQQQQQERQQQERRQADFQQRQQQQQQERASQRQQQQQQASAQQQPQQQRPRNDDHPHAEVHKPAEDKQKPQKDFEQGNNK
jgi:flagellar biosynthesis GTPase FlhF